MQSFDSLKYIVFFRNDSGIASMEVENLKIVNCGICGEEFLTNSKIVAS